MTAEPALFPFFILADTFKQKKLISNVKESREHVCVKPF